MESEIQRLADAAERIEREAGELRAAVEALTAASAPGQPAAATGGGPDDAEARLVAYSMVLDGVARAEVAAHLDAELGISDSDALLDELYADA